MDDEEKAGILIGEWGENLPLEPIISVSNDSSSEFLIESKVLFLGMETEVFHGSISTSKYRCFTLTIIYTAGVQW